MGGSVSKNAARLGLQCTGEGEGYCWVSDLGACLFDDSRDALALVDAWGRVVSINREYRLLFDGVGDLQPGAAVLSRGVTIGPSPLLDVVRLACAERLQRNEIIPFRHKHGFDIRLDVRVAPLRRGDGAIGGWLVRARLA